ncbi:MAG: phosphatidate cytidylyltransferase [Phycisphaerales bacterium]
MLKHRLLSGTLMTVLFVAVMLVDGWLDGSITSSITDDHAIQATILCVLICVLLVFGQLELSALTRAKQFQFFVPITIAASILLGTSWYWPRWIGIEPHIYIYFICAFIIGGLFLYQYLLYSTQNAIVNCGVNCFCIFYLGLLSAFNLAIRIDIGLWPFLMFIFVVKSSDIGAYTAGSLWGKHKFSPNLSPGKTWEGMAGAVVGAVLVSVLFAIFCDIIPWFWALLFGACFAFVGQMSDLAESLIKRDAERKDSASSVPGFGGILDVIDSVLFAAPFAYLFFMMLGL